MVIISRLLLRSVLPSFHSPLSHLLSFEMWLIRQLAKHVLPHFRRRQLAWLIPRKSQILLVISSDRYWNQFNHLYGSLIMVFCVRSSMWLKFRLSSAISSLNKNKKLPEIKNGSFWRAYQSRLSPFSVPTEDGARSILRNFVSFLLTREINTSYDGAYVMFKLYGPMSESWKSHYHAS